MALVAGSEFGLTLKDNVEAFGELGFAPHVAGLNSQDRDVLAAYHRDNRRSTEAGVKYFVLGALASGLLLYGSSLVYGFGGTTMFDGLAVAVSCSCGMTCQICMPGFWYASSSEPPRPPLNFAMPAAG